MAQEAEPGTHCPANKAADMLGDRWVLQIVRSMMLGATRYSDLQQAVPRISPTVLSARLKQLAEQGIIVKREGAGTRSASYRLSPSGRELKPLVQFLAIWGLKWAERNIKDENVDIGAMMWDVHKSLRTGELPDGETVFGIALTDVGHYAKWWIVAEGQNVDLCSDNPGKDIDVYLTTSTEALMDVWKCQRTVREILSTGELVVDGRQDLLRTIDNWFPVSPVGLELQESGFSLTGAAESHA